MQTTFVSSMHCPTFSWGLFLRCRKFFIVCSE
jgi:hypothetical protein